MITFRVAVLTVSLTLLGAGCAPAATTDLPSTPPAQTAPLTQGAASGTPTVDRLPPAASPAPFYIAYTKAEFDKARASGRPIVLYFWAGWCPICIAEEPTIKTTVEGMDVPIAGFRVDYDTETALKQEFRIPYQHTMVILDRSGKETERFSGPQSVDAYRTAFRDASR